ncbi:MAG: hypothetical protein ACK518_03750, partial [bacterium]
PTQRPTSLPTQRPTSLPTQRPTSLPTQRPTSAPTQRPTQNPNVPNCASLYGQCGGLNWKGTTCCAKGSFCKELNPYYYQCVFDEAIDSSNTCSALYAQCGGRNWNGPTCCRLGVCKFTNEFYSQCVPN